MCRLTGLLGLTCIERVSEALLGGGDLQDDLCCRLANSEQLLLNAEVVHLLREKADNRGASQRSLAGPELKVCSASPKSNVMGHATTGWMNLIYFLLHNTYSIQ